MSVFSYGMMRKCWEKAPDDRPTFKELYTDISKYIECIAGYLEMGFNPFAGGQDAEGQSDMGGKEGEGEGDFQFQLIPPSVRTNEAFTD